MIPDDEVRKRAKIHVKFTEHARLEMRNDDITVDDVLSALDGEVIEKYPNDKPFQSCLVYGKTTDGRPLHVVCTMPKNVDILIVITTYTPNEEEWIEFKKRRAR